jgi:sulfur carrier protein ThiS
MPEDTMNFEEAVQEPVENAAPQPAQTGFVKVIHDTRGEISVPYDELAAIEPTVTIRRIMARCTMQGTDLAYFVNGQPVADQDTVVNAGDEIYVAGKLVGGH